jgi:hypothetical protein
MAKKKRRKMHGLGDLVLDIADDVKDLVKDEFESQTRGRDSGKGGSSRGRDDDEARRSRERAAEMDDLRMAIQALSAKVEDIAREK